MPAYKSNSQNNPSSNLDLLQQDTPSSEVTSKLNSKKKKAKKNEVPAVAEQTEQEKTTKVLNNDGTNLSFTALSSNMAYRSSNTHTSPVFAALGDAFRDKTQDKSNQELKDDSQSPSTSPEREEVSNHRYSTSPPNRILPRPIAEEVRGGFSSHSPQTATSPRLAYRQISRRPSNYQNQAESLATSPRGRPVSMPAHMFSLPSGAAFNQLRGLTNDMMSDPSRSTSRKASKYNYVALDSLESAGDVSTSASENVLLAAHENTLYVYHLNKEKASRIGALEGLRGYVVSAKILPAPNRDDRLRSFRPLVAVIVHGPEIIGEDLSRPSSRHSDHSFDPSYPHDARAMPTITKYQTTVEIYSLKKHVHMGTLLASKMEEPKVENVYGKKSYEAPGPIGGFSIHATEKYIIVTSAESGEIYIYDTNSDRSQQQFRCIGKTWTSVSPKKTRTWSSSSPPDFEASRDKSPTRNSYPAPLMSARGRLLAYIPPIASSRSTIFATVRLVANGRPAPGLTSHTASSQPTTNCHVETPLEGSMVNELARNATQEILKGAKWAGDQGMQAWKNYWTPKSPDLNAQNDHNLHNQQFPPTHASDDPSRQTQRPTIISFLDMDELANSQDQRADNALQPIASFTLPGGCSFIDFNPSGLGLFTANAKGDVQNVWDLMQIAYPKQTPIGMFLAKGEVHPVIRQVARFVRVTEASIVDIAWLGCQGMKLAILTDRGTVHLHDLPGNTLDWPPRNVAQRRISEVQTPETQPQTPSTWGSAFSAVSSGAQTITATIRNNPLAQLSNFSLAQASAGAGAKGGKLVAAGFSRSVDAASGTVSSIMSMGETRLHLPGKTILALPGSTRWWSNRDFDAIAIVGNGLVRVFKVILKKEPKGKKKYSVVGERLAEIHIMDPSDEKETDWDMANDGYDVHGDWLSTAQARKYERTRSMTNPLSSAEIETNPPSQPLYSDPRMEFDTFTDDSNSIGNESFGQPISSEPVSAARFTRDQVESDLERIPEVSTGSRHEIGSDFISQEETVHNAVDPIFSDEPNLDFNPRPGQDITGLVDRIEEQLPIVEDSAPKEAPSKSKAKKTKTKKTKDKLATTPPRPANLGYAPWPQEDDEDGMNDLMSV